MFCLHACENLMDEIPLASLPEKEAGAAPVTLSETARLLSRLPIGSEQMGEVYDAVSASIDNGFDEEYLLSDLFAVPGSGVGERQLAEGTKSPGAKAKASANKKEYANPMRELIRSALQKEEAVKLRSGLCRGGGTDGEGRDSDGTRGNGTDAEGDGDGRDRPTGNLEETVEERIRLLCDEGVQIYWPYSENWDGESLPVITYDPGYGLETNTGWKLSSDGTQAEEILVDEKLAQSGCVWVVNSNEDAGLLPLSYLRKSDPSWGLPDHGTLVIDPQESALSGRMQTCADTGRTEGLTVVGRTEICTGGGPTEGLTVAGRKEGTKARAGSKTLLLKKFTAKRNFDTWFCGGSEFFIKIGKVEDFKATTEAEMMLYKPSITDFMVAVKRKDIGKELDFNALLVSEWTDQLSMCAFLITEDDGGTITKWDCNAVVKINSKSFGFEISIPVNSKDDIVWRGQLSGKYINATANLTGHFGDVDLVFEVVEY